MKRGMSPFWLVGALALLALLAAAWGGLAYMKSRAFAGLSPSQRAEYEAWRSESLTFPPEALDAKPFSDATLEASQTFGALWKIHSATILDLTQSRDRVRSSGNEPTQEELAAFEEKQTEIEPVLTAFERMAAQSDYDIDVSPSAHGPDEPVLGGIPVPNYLSLQCLAKTLRLRGHARSRVGRHADALGDAETIVRASKSNPNSLLISRLIGIAMLSIGTETWLAAVENCDDPALLRQTLARQAALVPESVIPARTRDFELAVTDHLGIIRAAKRAGIKTDVQGMTARQIVAEVVRVQAAYIEQEALPTLADAGQIEQARAHIESYRTQAATMGGAVQSPLDLLKRIGGRLGAPMLYAIAVPNFMEATTRDTVARAQFDLLRLATAWKVYRLERGSEPGALNDLVPDYLPELPKDPFAEDKKPYSRQPMLYSIGPDREDQQGAVRYDPSNGTRSEGDLYLGPK